MAQRIKGQEVQIIIVRGAALEDTLTDVQSFNAEFQSEIKTQGYLGEKANRVDDIFNQVKMDMELHLHTRDWFQFQQAIINRQKRLPGWIDLQFNVVATLYFPDGTTPSILFPDVKFGSIPLNVSTRGDYVKVKLDGQCDSYEYTQ
jgi:hypothetical protein